MIERMFGFRDFLRLLAGENQVLGQLHIVVELDVGVECRVENDCQTLVVVAFARGDDFTVESAFEGRELPIVFGVYNQVKHSGFPVDDVTEPLNIPPISPTSVNYDGCADSLVTDDKSIMSIGKPLADRTEF